MGSTVQRVLSVTAAAFDQTTVMAGVVVVETGEGWLVKVMWNE